MRTVLALLLLAPALAAAQSPVVLDLPEASPLPGEPGVTVARVLDLRADTSSVGEAKVGLFNRRRPVQIEGGTVPALTAYLQAALPPSHERTPLVVGIDVLHVSEQTTAVTEFGRAEVRLRFFEEVDDALGEVGRGHALVEGSGMDVTSGHSARLAEAVDRALVAFLTGEGPESPMPAAPIAEADLVGASLAEPASPELTDAAARSFRTFVVGGPLVGANGVGGRLGYGLRPIESQTWMVPVTLEAVVLRTENTGRGIEGVFSTFGGTIQAARRLGASNAYLQTGLQIAGGSERIGSDEGFFFGGRLGADLIHYPADRGVIAGLGVYGSRLFGSQLYPRDVGVSVTLGGQF